MFGKDTDIMIMMEQFKSSLSGKKFLLLTHLVRFVYPLVS